MRTWSLSLEIALSYLPLNINVRDRPLSGCHKCAHDERMPVSSFIMVGKEKRIPIRENLSLTVACHACTSAMSASRVSGVDQRLSSSKRGEDSVICSSRACSTAQLS